MGAAGTLQDINVAISTAKEKLITLGNFDMMLNGWTSSIYTKYHYRSPARNLAHLIDLKYVKVIDPPPQRVRNIQENPNIALPIDEY